MTVETTKILAPLQHRNALQWEPSHTLRACFDRTDIPTQLDNESSTGIAPIKHIFN